MKTQMSKTKANSEKDYHDVNPKSMTSCQFAEEVGHTDRWGLFHDATDRFVLVKGEMEVYLDVKIEMVLSGPISVFFFFIGVLDLNLNLNGFDQTEKGSQFKGKRNLELSSWRNLQNYVSSWSSNIKICDLPSHQTAIVEFPLHMYEVSWR